MSQESSRMKNDTITTETTYIVKPYSPKISDAFKVKEIPSISDDLALKRKSIKYNIFSIPVASTFVPAKTLASSIEKSAPLRLFDNYVSDYNELTFISKYSGILKVKKEGDYLILDFPIGEFKKITMPEEIIKGLGKIPLESYKGKTDYLFIYNNQKDIEDLNPDFQILSESEARGIIGFRPQSKFVGILTVR